MHHRRDFSVHRRVAPAKSAHRSQRARLAVVAILVTFASLAVAPAAHADATTALKEAVTAARSGAACPLRSDPLVDQIADIVNKSTDDYLNQTATRVPIVDAQEGLKQLGYPGTKAYLLQGADKTDVLAIKGALLEGYDALPDCSYTDFGVSVKRNSTTGFSLTVVVLAGP